MIQVYVSFGIVIAYVTLMSMLMTMFSDHWDLRHKNSNPSNTRAKMILLLSPVWPLIPIYYFVSKRNEVGHA